MSKATERYWKWVERENARPHRHKSMWSVAQSGARRAAMGKREKKRSWGPLVPVRPDHALIAGMARAVKQHDCGEVIYAIAEVLNPCTTGGQILNAALDDMRR